MLKKDELRHPSSCFNKAAPEEPVFVLRGKDSLSAMTVRHWITMATGIHEPEKLEEAEGLARKMDAWRGGNDSVYSDSDEPIKPVAVERFAGEIPRRFPVQMVKLGKNGERLMADAADHAAVLLPAFGLIFTKDIVKAQNTAEAARQASECRTCGADDWVVPELIEQLLIVDYTRHSPAINVDFFPSTRTDDYYLTATASASGPDCVRVVSFSYGSVNGVHRDNSGYVRFVRRVPASQ